MPRGLTFGVDIYEASRRLSTPPAALTSFVLDPGPYYGRIPFTANGAAVDPNLYAVKVYLAPTGAALDKAAHANKTFPLEPGAPASFIWGPTDPVANVLVNADFAAPAPPPLTIPAAGFEVSGGKLVLIPKVRNLITSLDGVDWTASPGPVDRGWTMVAWSPTLNLFAMVASTGGTAADRIATSPDGITWTTRSAPELMGLLAICWGGPAPGCFIAVANTGVTTRCLRSTDGITWSLVHPAVMNTRNWIDVCWSPELNLFCAIASSSGTSRIATSPDGITWTLRASPADSWFGICWGGPPVNLFVGVGITNTKVMTSPDGLVWTLRNAPADVNNWRSVCWSPERQLFVAVSDSGTGTQTTRVMTSPNGIDWSLSVLPFVASPGGGWKTVLWAAGLGLFVATGTGVTTPHRIMTSPDGFAWTYRSCPLTNTPALNGMGWSPDLGKLVSVAADNNSVFEVAAWPIASNLGETWRTAFNIDVLTFTSGGIVPVFGRNNMSLEGWGTFNTTGRKLVRKTRAVDDNPMTEWGFLANNPLFVQGATLDDAVLFKESPDMAPQGFWDIHAFPLNDAQVEGPGFAPIINVEVV